MNNGSSSASRQTAQLDPETRRNITLSLCHEQTTKMLVDAGRASQTSRGVDSGGMPQVIHLSVAFTANITQAQKPIRQPAGSGGGGQGTGQR